MTRPAIPLAEAGTTGFARNGNVQKLVQTSPYYEG